MKASVSIVLDDTQPLHACEKSCSYHVVSHESSGQICTRSEGQSPGGRDEFRAVRVGRITYCKRKDATEKRCSGVICKYIMPNTEHSCSDLCLEDGGGWDEV